MRNLRSISFEETVVPKGLPITATAWDTLNDATICAFGPTPTQPVIELKRRLRWASDFEEIASWDAPCPLPELEADEVILLQYFADLNTACLVLAGGDIIIVREDPGNGQERVEIVGSVDAGISAAAWAPDEEVLVIVTRTDVLVLMSKDFEPVTETILTADDLKASKHVSVGWGKKETQFQGKRAKAMKDPTMPEIVDEGKPSLQDDGRTSVSWRGDGAYFAVNRIVADGRRAIRVFSREGVLDSTSEPVDGLESAVSWKPSGSLVAGVKRSEGKIEVVFFERNGLRHGEYNLRLSQDDMNTWASRISLCWNLDSSVLAVIFRDRVQLWTVSNYHYYLKQEIRCGSLQKSPETSLPWLRWHPESSLRLTLLSSASLIETSYLSTISRGTVLPPHDCGVVGVIDGKNLKLTPLKQAGVPPPMSFCDVSFDHSIVDCAFSANGERLAVLTSATLEICTWKMQEVSSMNEGGLASKSKRYSTNITKQSLRLPCSDRNIWSARYTHVIFKGNQEVLILAPAQRATNAQARNLMLEENIADPLFRALEVPNSTQSLITDIQQDSIWSMDHKQTTIVEPIVDGGDATKYNTFHSAIPDSVLFRIPAGDTDGMNGYHESIYHRVSLTPKGMLQVDEHVLAKDCSSFVVTDAHIIFTTIQHLLKFVHLAEPAAMDVPGNTPEVDERCRSIEQGAKIITVIPSAYSVVLQMPRGNLETIFPRVLVVSGIRQHIASLDYRTAFLACQTHQVDLNILHDYQPDIFLGNITKFIDELKKPARVDEFISKLKEEDVTQTLYRDTLKQTHTNGAQSNGLSSTSPTSKPSGKVNRICDALITALTSRSSTYLQNIITAHVCKRPPDLNAALGLVSKLRLTSTEEADLAISHLCFLTDTNRLYDAALALYDLEVTLLVAQNAQRDPREYMPFLQKLQSLPQFRRQYTIDNHLKNYAKALTSLHALSVDDEIEAYTIRHSLYSHALDLYKYSPTHSQTITRHYASHLASTSQPLHAATLYDSLQDYTTAYPLYALAHRWRESLTCATLIPLEASQLISLATQLAETLVSESHDYRSAATIHVDYLHNIPEAALLLCRGSYFADATRLLSLHSLAPQIPSILDPALLEKSSEILSLLTDCRSQLTAQVPRILELRRLKSLDPLAFYGGDPTSTNPDALETDFADNMSLAPTESTVANQSLFTRYSSTSKFGGTVASNVSRKTSKTRRKEERKRARGKKGSVYEEEYLVSSVSRLFARVNGTHGEVERLVLGLVRRGMREQAQRVDEGMMGVGEAMEKAKEEIWAERAERLGGENRVEGWEAERRPRGADGVFWESQQQQVDGEGQGREDVPEVKAWKGGEIFAH